MTKADEFHGELDRIFDEAANRGAVAIDVNSGALHRQLGGYPAKKHHMPTCCNVMTSKMCSADTILAAPPKGRGATLTIRYRLPR